MRSGFYLLWETHAPLPAQAVGQGHHMAAGLVRHLRAFAQALLDGAFAGQHLIFIARYLLRHRHAAHQAVFFVIAAVCAVAFLLFALVYKMPPGATGDMGVEGTFKESLKYCKNRRIWILGAVFFLFAFTTIGIMNTYYNTFLETQLGFGAQTASSLSSIIMLLSLIVAPLTGFVSDRLPLGRKYLVGLVMMGMLFLTGWCMFYTGPGAVAVMWFVIVLQGVGGGMCGGSLRPMAPMLMRNTAMGATMAMAIMQFCQNLGSTLGSPVFGALQEAIGWDMAGIVLQIPAYVIAFVLCLFILPRGKNVKTLDDVPAEEAWPRGF